MSDPRITDNDHGEISASVNGKEIRGWSYKEDDAERRIKMLMAHEFAEGWFQCAALRINVDDDTKTLEEAADEIEQMRTALRRIASLGEKNVPKYAQEIARNALNIHKCGET